MRYTREQACLAWLAQGMLGSRRLKKLLDEYGSAEAAYDAFQRDHGASLQNRISDYSLSLLRASASREKLHDMLVTMRKWNMGLVSMADDMYPESLRNILLSGGFARGGGQVHHRYRFAERDGCRHCGNKIALP